MVRTRFVAAALVLAFGAVSAAAQEATPPPTATAQTLPAGWQKLELTAEQARKVADLRRDYQQELADLEARIASLKRLHQEQLVNVLSPGQRQRLWEPAANGPKDGRANAGKRWTAQESAELLRAFEASVALQELANRHQRSEAAIRSRLHLLGVRSGALTPGRQP